MVNCKCCAAEAKLLGAVDLNKTCEDHKGKAVFPYASIPILYYRCNVCGFIFTDYFDNWKDAEFKQQIYNEDYGKADPDFVSGARSGIANHLANILYPSKENIQILDYGSGGNPGHLGKVLLSLGFNLSSYDKFYEANIFPSEKFDVIYSVEVIEHCPDVKAFAEDIAVLLKPQGILWLATGLHPHQAGPEILNSWYIAPRNGHVSIFTLPALTALFRPYGITIMQAIGGIIGFKTRPDFPNQIFA